MHLLPCRDVMFCYIINLEFFKLHKNQRVFPQASRYSLTKSIAVSNVWQETGTRALLPYFIIWKSTELQTLIQDPPWAGSLKCPMLMAQTAIQITVMTLDSCWENSSSFCCSGVFSVSVSIISLRILPEKQIQKHFTKLI